MLSGADEVRDRVAREGPWRPAYCLGYCDRSPAVWRAPGWIETGDAALGRAGRAFDEETSVRCIAREAIVTARIGRGDFSSLERARGGGVYEALASAVTGPGEAILHELERSGERGRGGASFPTARKWRLAAAQAAPGKFVVANGDEGDPGSFVDRLLLERDPHALIEGLALCGVAIGARRGFVYIRSEYPEAAARMRRAVEQAREAGILGEALLGRGPAFDVEVVSGHGSYVCGEETALLSAIEGRRGEVRIRPPYPAESGLYGRPTVVNNVETLVNVPWIVRRGADAYRALGTEASSGTKAICLGRGFARPGVLEVELGVSLRSVVEEHGGGAREGRPLRAIAIGGPMGSVVDARGLDVAVCYSAMDARGIVLGHGGIVAIPEGTDLVRLVEHWLEFMAGESCGKCVPCRLGSQRGLEIARTGVRGPHFARLPALLDTIARTSLCAFGQLIPSPVRTLLDWIAAEDSRA